MSESNFKEYMDGVINSIKEAKEDDIMASYLAWKKEQDALPEYVLEYSTWTGPEGDDKEVVNCGYFDDLEKAKKAAKELSIEREDLVDVVSSHTSKMYYRYINGQATDFSNNPIEEGVGKTLGALATAATIGLGNVGSADAVALSDMSRIEPSNVMRSKMDLGLPQWIQNANGDIVEQDGKYYFVSGIEKGKDSNNTSQLEREASLNAGNSMLNKVKDIVNQHFTNAYSNYKPIDSNIKISGMIPKGSYWQMGKNDKGDVVYQAFAKTQIDRNKMVDAMVNKVAQSNPQLPKKQVQEEILASLRDLGLK